jgi:hypothetical protein
MVLYYIWGALSLIGACIGTVYIIGAGVLAAAPANGDESEQAVLAGVFGVIGIIILVLSLASGALNVMAAIGIGKRKWRVLTYIAAGLACLSIPIGTALGIYTFIALARPGVQALYQQARIARGA